MADSSQRKRAHSTAHGLGRNIKDVFRGPSPQRPDASASAEQTSSPTTSQPTIPAASNTSTAHQAPSADRRGLRDWARDAMTELETALKGLQLGAKLCPPLASATEGLLDCMDVMRDAAQASNEFNLLAKSLADVMLDVEQHMRESHVLQLSKTAEHAISELNKEVENLKARKKGWGPMRVAEVTRNMDDLRACYRRVQLMFQRLQSNAILSVWSNTHEHLNTRLANMHPSKVAWYNSAMAAVVGRRRCTPDTRTAILEQLHEWVDDTGPAKVYWINGMAGTGKTTISYTFCEELKQKYELGASFFCSHRLPDCRDASRIIPTIAYQLARFSHPFQAALCRALEKDPDAGLRAVSEQFETLLSKPLLEVKDTMVEGKTAVVVVEALDECVDRVNVQQFIDALFYHVSSLPVRFFVTCRPTPGIYEKLQLQYASSRSVLRLHDIQEAVVRSDIEAYLTAELAGVPSGIITRLAELSGKLFIFAATVVGYVKPRGGSVRQKRLDTIVSATWSQGDGVYRSIDALYTAILSAASCDEESDEMEKTMTMRVLYTVICLREPLTTRALADLLDSDVDDVELALEPLLPVLHISEEDSLVSTLHASFPDYMLSKERSGQYFCDPDVQNAYIARRSLEIMMKLLRFNICDLETSYPLDEKVPNIQQRIQCSIPPHLAYACKYLGEHICRAQAVQELASCCVEFVTTRMLYWIEVLSLLKCVSIGIKTVERIQTWLQVASGNETDGLLRNGRKFLSLVERYDVSQSTPHVYVSMLASWDRDEPIWRWYGSLFRGLLSIKEVEIAINRSTHLEAWSAREDITDRARGPDMYSNSETYPVFAPDASRYAFRDSSGIYVCDTHTRSIVSGPYAADRSQRCRSSSFSYNGKWIATVSHEHEIILWNTCTENRVSSLPRLHTRTTQWIKLSTGDFLLACHDNEYLGIWNLCTLTCQAWIRPGEPSFASSAWSPDGGQLAAPDQSVVLGIWDTRTGQKLFNAGGNRGRREFIFTQYSHSGARIALIGESEFSIWDARSGDKLVGPLKTYGKLSFPVFTPDDRYIVLCGEHIGVWDTHTGDVVAGPYTLPDHDQSWGFPTIAFTPDGYLTYLTLDHTQFKWRLDTQGIAATSVSWTIDKDGWVTSANEEKLLWIPPDLFKRPSKNPIVMHDREPFRTAWDTFMVGERWKGCYVG